MACQRTFHRGGVTWIYWHNSSANSDLPRITDKQRSSCQILPLSPKLSESFSKRAYISLHLFNCCCISWMHYKQFVLKFIITPSQYFVHLFFQDDDDAHSCKVGRFDSTCHPKPIGKDKSVAEDNKEVEENLTCGICQVNLFHNFKTNVILFFIIDSHST